MFFHKVSQKKDEFKKCRPLILSPWPVFRKFFWKFMFQASTKLRREITSKKPAKNHARTMKKSCQKTVCFSTSLFSYFYLKWGRSGTPNWRPKSQFWAPDELVGAIFWVWKLNLFSQGPSEPPKIDFGAPRGRFWSPRESIWESELIFGDICQ